MQDTKFVKLFKTFSKQEVKDFEKFVSSPYFSKRRNIKPLYTALKKHYPAFQSPHFTQEKIFRHLFPGKKFDKKKSSHALSVMLSELSSLAEKFLAIEQLQKGNEKYRMTNALIRSLENRNMGKDTLKLILDSIEQVQKHEISTSFFMELIILNKKLADFYFFQRKFKKVFEYVQNMQLLTYGCYLELFHQLVNCYGALETSFIKIPVNTKFLSIGLNNFDPVMFEKDFYDDGQGTKMQILMNFYIIKALLDKNDEESFFAAIKYFKSNFEKFNWHIKRYYFSEFLNICTDRIRFITGKKYHKIGSDLVDFAINNRIYSHYPEDHLSIRTFFIYFGFKNGVLELNNIKIITDKMLELVDNKHKQMLHDYAYSWICFKERDYERTLEFISKTHSLGYPEINMLTKLRILSLYSLNYIEEAIYNLNSYEHFVRSHIIQANNKKNKNLDFIKAVRLLINYRTKPTGTIDELTLSKTIDEYKNDNISPWFEEEIEKLKCKK